MEDKTAFSIQEPSVKQRPIYYDTLVLSGASTKALITLGAIQYAFDNF